MQTERVSRLLKTLSDPTRLRLLRLIEEQELSVMELAEATGLAQSRVSNHLRLLRDEELVAERREGAWRFYRVDAAELEAGTRTLWEAVRSTFGDDEQALADRARLEGILARRHTRRGRFFEQIADQWDGIRTEMFGDTIARELLRAFLPPNLTVADIGCGTGYGIELFGTRAHRIIGIDSSEAMLSVARRKVAAHGLDNVELRGGDAHDPPLKKAEADVVSLIMVLHHLERPFEALAAAARALRPDGRVLIVDFFRHEQTWLRDLMEHRWLGFKRAELEAALTECGLRVREWTTLPGRPWETPDNRRVSVPDGFLAVAAPP